jgi:hypothetical protein
MLRHAYAALALTLALPLMFAMTRTADAAPLPAIAKSTLSESLVTPVHGCHRHCTWGFVPRWGTTAYHRHRGPHCRPRPCGRRYYGPPPYYGYGPSCFKLGPVWYCP